MLINVHDTLFESLQQHMLRTGEHLRLKVMERPTSVENLCHLLFSEITQMGFRLSHIEVQETDTSTVSYCREDWIRDNRPLTRPTPMRMPELASSI